MKFAIRDDDTCYFTRPEEIERIYAPLWPSVPVSLAVTPFAVESFNLGEPARFYQGSEPRALSANTTLCSWLRGRVASGHVSVMLHGFTHEYRRRRNGQLVQEYVWKRADRIARETVLGARHLEDTLGLRPTTFVPPGNAISSRALHSVGASITRLLTTVPLRRPALNGAWLRRCYHHLRHGGPNPHPEFMGAVCLLPSYTLSRTSSFDSLRGRFLNCLQSGADFILAVHYWELTGATLDALYRLVDFALAQGARSAMCDELFPPASPPASAVKNPRFTSETA